MYIKGVGMTKFDYSQKPWWQFAYEAAMEAMEDGKTNISKIDAIILSAISSCDGYLEHQTHKSSFISDLFKTNVPIIEIPAVCGGGGVAFWTALRLIKDMKNILVVSGEKVVNNKSEYITHRILSASERVLEQTEGMIFPAQNALMWQEYQKKYSATMDDLALIAFKNHQNAFLNPKAYFYKQQFSLEKIKNSPVVASPFRLFDCSISMNGGAAVIISQEESDIKVIGSGFATDYILDIDVAELHAAFTSVELISYEDLGFADIGKGAELIRSGKINLDGELPINPSGGLKAKGHPISVTGLAQIYEIVNQLRGRCGERQVKNNPQIGLTHNVGGAGGSAVAHIFRKK